MSTIKNKQEVLEKIDTIKHLTGEGHYLTRLFHALYAFKFYAQAEFVLAARVFSELNHKAPGSDEIMLEFSRLILSVCKEHGLSIVDVTPLAWALELDALKEYGYAAARKVREGETNA